MKKTILTLAISLVFILSSFFMFNGYFPIIFLPIPLLLSMGIYLLLKKLKIDTRQVLIASLISLILFLPTLYCFRHFYASHLYRAGQNDFSGNWLITIMQLFVFSLQPISGFFIMNLFYKKRKLFPQIFAILVFLICIIFQYISFGLPTGILGAYKVSSMYFSEHKIENPKIISIIDQGNQYYSVCYKTENIKKTIFVQGEYYFHD